jgi:D-Tyr-tRNAtyr deacylase
MKTKKEKIMTTIEDIDMIDPNFKKLICLNQKQTAQILGVSCSSLENWRKEGIGPSYKKIENGKRSRVLYSKSKIVEWLNQTVKTA